MRSVECPILVVNMCTVSKMVKLKGNNVINVNLVDFGTRFTSHGSSLWLRALAVFLYCHGLSCMLLRKCFLFLRLPSCDGYGSSEYNTHTSEPETGTTVVLELDEMWHYLKKRKLCFGIQENSLPGNGVIGIKQP